jgi:threonine synthase
MAAPIAVAFEKGSAEVAPVIARETIAESIQVGNPAALGWRALSAVRESNGIASACTDAEILEAQSFAAKLAGIFADPAAAVSLAAAKKLRAAGLINRQDVVVCNVTGHGLKQPEAVRVSEDELRPISPNLIALQDRLRRRET